jgi:hypothetical protein
MASPKLPAARISRWEYMNMPGTTNGLASAATISLPIEGMTCASCVEANVVSHMQKRNIIV